METHKKALVTSTGQDASYLTELLLEKGYYVIVLHRRSSSPNFDRFDSVIDHPNLEFVCGDITDYSSVHNMVLKYLPDEIYCLAAQSFVGASFSQPMYTLQCTGMGCVNFLECLRSLQSTTPDYHPKMYQASTSEMFGSSVSYYHDGLRIDDNWNHLTTVDQDSLELFQDELTPFCPESPYAVAKLMAHNMCQLYRRCYGMFITSSILYNHGSPRRGEEFVTRKITKYVAKLKKWIDTVKQTSKYRFISSNLVDQGDCVAHMEPDLTCHTFPKLRLGNLDSFRDWSHAKDMVRGMWMIMQQDIPDDYVLASGESHSVREFLDAAFSHIGVDDWSNIVMQDPQFMRPSEVPHLCGRATKAKKALGWENEISFKELVAEMVDSDLEKS